jgi:hypothetical protein
MESVPDLVFNLFWFRASWKNVPLKSLSHIFLFVIGDSSLDMCDKQVSSVLSWTSTEREYTQVNFHDCHCCCYCIVNCHCHSLLLQLLLHFTIKERERERERILLFSLSLPLPSWTENININCWLCGGRLLFIWRILKVYQELLCSLYFGFELCGRKIPFEETFMSWCISDGF